MDMKRFFLYAIVIAALALAGCGGNGGTTTATPPPTDPPPTTPPPPPAGPTVQDLFEIAQDSRDDAEVAKTDAMDAVEAATEASGKLGVLNVKGNSMMAQMNAQTVLDSRDKANGAYQTAKDALADLMQADEDADEHDNNSLDSAIAAAIKVAEDAVKAAKEQAESNELETAVEKVTGDDPEADGYPKTAVQLGAGVAMQIGMALGPTGPTDGQGTRVVVQGPDTEPPTMTVAPMGVSTRKDNHKGMTWAQIVGDDNIVTKRIDSGTDTTRAVPAMSVNGMTLTSGQTVEAEVADGTQVATGIEYKGIPGTVFCQGDDCAVQTALDENGASVDTMRVLAGSWYFTPTNRDHYYVKPENATSYMRETMYARYGYWLTQNEAGTQTTVNLFAAPGTNTTAQASPALAIDATFTDSSATYTGSAIGVSLHKELDSDGGIVPGTLQSGEFEADVTLTATFGTSPTISGMVDNFRSYSNEGAVDTDWEVKFLPTAWTGALDDSAPGTTVASGQDGEYTAHSYGPDSGRPIGAFGTFNAHFSDGHAAGAYATRE